MTISHTTENGNYSPVMCDDGSRDPCTCCLPSVCAVWVTCRQLSSILSVCGQQTEDEAVSGGAVASWFSDVAWNVAVHGGHVEPADRGRLFTLSRLFLEFGLRGCQVGTVLKDIGGIFDSTN